MKKTNKKDTNQNKKTNFFIFTFVILLLNVFNSFYNFNTTKYEDYEYSYNRYIYFTFDHYSKILLKPPENSDTDLQKAIDSFQETINYLKSDEPQFHLKIPLNSTTKTKMNTQIKSLQRKLSLIYHPDKNINLSETEKQNNIVKLNEINEASERLLQFVKCYSSSTSVIIHGTEYKSEYDPECGDWPQILYKDVYESKLKLFNLVFYIIFVAWLFLIIVLFKLVISSKHVVYYMSIYSMIQLIFVRPKFILTLIYIKILGEYSRIKYSKYDPTFGIFA